ncbi:MULTISPECIES: XapX domain-containing protein [unclassified Bradyrhizobium]|uniref:XapX domain-containing protein n=1 Tax=unclassified Bradyrhizobium TaxID=2631580 RepID=UPI0028E78785|nr:MULTISPECIES: XapX domain-containing protein [unclassified Bradyrhizobium]
MKIYLFSLGAGLLVGVIYSLLQVRSPAPPLVALVGLLGILVGEQVIPVGRQLLDGSSIVAAWQKAACATHIFGLLPGHHGRAETNNNAAPDEKAS